MFAPWRSAPAHARAGAPGLREAVRCNAGQIAQLPDSSARRAKRPHLPRYRPKASRVEDR